MASLNSEIVVKMNMDEFDKILFHLCDTTSCRNNLHWQGKRLCNLKNICIADGVCTNYQKLE